MQCRGAYWLSDALAGFSAAFSMNLPISCSSTSADEVSLIRSPSGLRSLSLASTSASSRGTRALLVGLLPLATADGLADALRRPPVVTLA